MGNALEIQKQVWVNSTGKKYSVDLHAGKDGRSDYLMITEHTGNRRYRISIPLPMVGHLIEAIHDALET
ncbi:hypothetical protein [Sodaliphilus pleomorphus]|uniref:Uncharacterized protein n=1 Tax=Sodaliphilus pleomorphus TaxID=2606626 RepID=A0A6L5X7H1_9BACT|nr:hypothetical protein [Sodaliphilus pleomorphus]MSS16210.1 hypothetical protein [Sodaliphilus pleomorphus]